MRKIQFEAGTSQLIALFVSDDTGESVDPAAIYGAVAADAAAAEPLGWRIASMDTFSVRQLGTAGNILFDSGGRVHDAGRDRRRVPSRGRRLNRPHSLRTTDPRRRVASERRGQTLACSLRRLYEPRPLERFTRMGTSPDVDAYLEALPEHRRRVMELMRRTIAEAAPEASEAISYKMPAFKMDDRFLVSYDAYKDHYSLFPASDGMIEALGDELAPYLSGKGTIRFPADQPLPTALIAKVVRIRVAEHTHPRGE